MQSRKQPRVPTQAGAAHTQELDFGGLPEKVKLYGSEPLPRSEPWANFSEVGASSCVHAQALLTERLTGSNKHRPDLGNSQGLLQLAPSCYVPTYTLSI